MGEKDVYIHITNRGYISTEREYTFYLEELNTGITRSFSLPKIRKNSESWKRRYHLERASAILRLCKEAYANERSS